MVMRQQVWIDRHVQGVLVGRVLIYWSGIVLYFALSTLCTNWWQYPEWTLSEHCGALVETLGPCLPTLVLLLPLVVFDIVRLSNRFAGPIYRLRNHLVALQDNSHCPALNFRDDDYWQQLADPINAVQRKLLAQEEQLAALSFVHKALADAGTNAEPSATDNSGYVSIVPDDPVLAEAKSADTPSADAKSADTQSVDAKLVDSKSVDAELNTAKPDTAKPDSSKPDTTKLETPNEDTAKSDEPNLSNFELDELIASTRKATAVSSPSADEAGKLVAAVAG